jgi:hypothetical protein
MNSLFSYSRPHVIEVPFVKAVFGGEEFGLSSEFNSSTKVRRSDMIVSLGVSKYGSGAVNTYTLNMRYVIGKDQDPNYVDLALSKAFDRKIYFTYGDLSQPDYSYKNEEAIITSVVPNVNYKANTIDYTITATSSVALSSAIKRSFEAVTDKPSRKIIEVLYRSDLGLLDLLPGMADKEKVLANGWIPDSDKEVQISEKIDISPMDYILYLVSLMKGETGCYYFLKIMDSIDQSLPHFEIVSTDSKGEGQRLNIDIGFPGSVPVFNFSVSENSSTSLLVDYQDKIDKSFTKDYSFRGDLVSTNYYPSDLINGAYSADLKNWWDKMKSFPISASITTPGLYAPAEIVKSVYLNIYFFGKKYWHSGEYLIISQTDSISMAGFRTTLGLMKIGGDKDVQGQNISDNQYGGRSLSRNTVFRS